MAIAPRIPLSSKGTLVIVMLSFAIGFGAAFLQPYLFPVLNAWTPDYYVYWNGARLAMEGLDPHALLNYWYPLPVVLVTTMPWALLPYRFVLAFAIIPLCLLVLRYGRWTPLWLLFVPIIINTLWAQAEAWLIFAVFWILEGQAVKGSVGIIALMFKPAYGIFLVPYRLWTWYRDRHFKAVAWLIGGSVILMGAAFVMQPAWPLQWFNGILRRHNNASLIKRNMTVWSYFDPDRSPLLLILLILILLTLIILVIQLWRFKEARAGVALSLSLFFFPGGLNPANSMMVIPLIRTPGEILLMCAVSWGVRLLDIRTPGGFGGYYLLIVLAAMALLLRRLKLHKESSLQQPECELYPNSH